jgi:hypothetical protein
LKMTRDRYKKMDQVDRVDELLGKSLQRTGEINRDALGLAQELIDEIKELERQMRLIPGSVVSDERTGT